MPSSAYTDNLHHVARDYRPSYDATQTGYQTTQTTASGSSYAAYGVYGDVAQGSGSNLAGIANGSAGGAGTGGSTYRKPDAKRKVSLASFLPLLSSRPLNILHDCLLVGCNRRWRMWKDLSVNNVL